VETQTGRWCRRDLDLVQGEEIGDEVPLTGIKPFVTDSRNLLLLRPIVVEPSEDFLVSLLYALKRGIHFVHFVTGKQIGFDMF
jgi:hypothetical protein